VPNEAQFERLAPLTRTDLLRDISPRSRLSALADLNTF
jgi:hypothetical protein